MKIEEIYLGIKVFVPEFFSSNVYLIDNELLVDAGTRKFGKMLGEKFHELGIKPKILVLTNCHWDHIGGANILQKEFGLKILLYEQDTKVIKNTPEHTFAFVFNEKTCRSRGKAFTIRTEKSNKRRYYKDDWKVY